MTRDFKWASVREGPEHDTIYHFTAFCKRSLVTHRYYSFIVCDTVRGVSVGIGHASSKGAAKRNASVQALEYLRSHGEESKCSMMGIWI